MFCAFRNMILQNPDYMRDDFFIHIETIHLPDRGTTQNAHNLSSEDLAKREVIDLDIANDTSYLTASVSAVLVF